MDKQPPTGEQSQRAREGTISQSPAEAEHSVQRRHPRIRCFVAVQMRPESDHGLVLGNLSDVSLGGCGIESANHVDAGIPIALCPLTAAGELWVKGVIANSRFSEGTGSFHLGVRFLEECPPGCDHNIEAFVNFIEQTAARQTPVDPYLKRIWGL